MADSAVMAVPHAGEQLAKVVPRRALVRPAVHLRVTTPSRVKPPADTLPDREPLGFTERAHLHEGGVGSRKAHRGSNDRKLRHGVAKQPSAICRKSGSFGCFHPRDGAAPYPRVKFNNAKDDGIESTRKPRGRREKLER